MVCDLIRAGADIHALNKDGYSPLRLGCGSLLVASSYTNSEFRRDDISEHLEKVISFWLDILSSASVDLHAYICKERELGFERRFPLWIACQCRGEGDSIDKDWYMDMKFIYSEDKQDNLKSHDIAIEVDMFWIKRTYDIPGAWSTSSDDVSQKSGYSDDESQQDYEVRSEDSQSWCSVHGDDNKDFGPPTIKRRNSI